MEWEERYGNLSVRMDFHSALPGAPISAISPVWAGVGCCSVLARNKQREQGADGARLAGPPRFGLLIRDYRLHVRARPLAPPQYTQTPATWRRPSQQFSPPDRPRQSGRSSRRTRALLSLSLFHWRPPFAPRNPSPGLSLPPIPLFRRGDPIEAFSTPTCAEQLRNPRARRGD